MCGTVSSACFKKFIIKGLGLLGDKKKTKQDVKEEEPIKGGSDYLPYPSDTPSPPVGTITEV